MKKILNLIKKYRKTSIFLGILIIIFFVIFFLSQGKVYEKEELEYGVTFSQLKAQSLGLDWQELYLATLDDLGVKKIRLAAYWSEIEAENDNFYFKDLDWQIEKAQERGVEVILAVGGRLPRWPECHFPAWAESLSSSEREKEILEYIKRVINRYKGERNITAWQVENEPFLSSHFGECPSLNIDFLDKEIELVRKLDSRPIIVTDSGELSIWVLAARRADIFGTTMYRDTYSEKLKRYVHYPIGPGFFHFKKNVADWFAEPEKWIVIELQAEPWTPIAYQEVTKEEREKTMSPQKFREMLEFARQAGFKEFYLWGVEYWYWEKIKNGEEEMWEIAKNLFKK